jgi:(p)ppGpp synthase/HD superfamily hydrolase
VSGGDRRLSPPVPHFGRRTEEAFTYALAVHGAQVRKGGPVPYVSHLMAVASLVIEDGGDEDQVVGALLHDAVEDQGGEPRLEDIAHRFGDRVAAIVRACSDSLAEDPRDKDPWADRKAAYLVRLAEESDEGILRVSLGDKLHNARAIASDAAADASAWRRFNAPPDLIAAYYRACHDVLARRLPGSRFVPDLEIAVTRLERLAADEMARRAEGGAPA